MRLSAKKAREMGLDVPPSKGGPQTGRKVRETALAMMAASHGLPVPAFEFPWHPERKFRFDMLFEGWLAVEIVGGVWVRGHHSRGKDQIEDMHRRNEAQRLGYQVLEFPPEQIQSGAAFSYIKAFLDGRE